MNYLLPYRPWKKKWFKLELLAYTHGLEVSSSALGQKYSFFSVFFWTPFSPPDSLVDRSAIRVGWPM